MQKIVCMKFTLILYNNSTKPTAIVQMKKMGYQGSISNLNCLKSHPEILQSYSLQL